MLHSAQSKSKYDPPTAAKSNYNEGTPYKPTEYDNSSYRPSSRYSLKLNEAKNMISGLIGEISAKKSLNEEGVKRVHDFNAEAIEALNSDEFFGNAGSQPIGFHLQDKYRLSTPQKGSKGMRNIERMPKTSGYEDYQSTGAFPSHIRSTSDFVMGSMNYSQSQPLEEDNRQLREALQHQFQQNQQLLSRIEYLQAGNRHKKSFSSPYDNKGNVPEYILRELEELKRENEFLRKDTIRLLNQK